MAVSGRTGRRPRIVPSSGRRFTLRLSDAIATQIEQLAAEERRTLTAQIELLLERGLRSYGLELTA